MDRDKARRSRRSRRATTRKMRRPLLVICGLVALVTVACGRRAPQPEKAAPPASSPVSDADRAVVLKAANLSANAQGQVKNECDVRRTGSRLVLRRRSGTHAVSTSRRRLETDLFEP